MKILQVINEANVASKIKDPKTIKMLSIAMRHDHTLPKRQVAMLGAKPTEEQVLKLWSDMLDTSLRSTDYGDISADGKFDEWLTRLYMNGVLEYEDINGEGGDALGAWKALSVRGKLKPEHQDFNKFRNLRQIQSIVQNRDYRNELERIKDQATIEQHKRDRKEVTIVDDDRYLVVVPMNYGSCYTFNNSAGFKASFCTGSSSGATWFKRYAVDGPVISVIDKNNYEDVNGKWQIHAPTNQINNGNQTVRRDEKFAELFPGLMKKIVAGLQANAEEIKTSSTEIVRDGYDINSAVEDLKKTFPLSFASGEQEEEPQQEPQEQTYLITLTSSGRQARIQATSEEDAIDKVIARHPSINRDDLTVEGPLENEQ